MADAKSIQDPVVRALAEHIASFQFQRTFEEFFLKHALAFSDEVEHDLNYMTIYLEFQEVFNKQMEGFLEKQGVTEEEFVKIVQKATKSDKRADNFLEIVLASMDYDAFYLLMKAMRGRASAEKKNKRGENDDDDGADAKSPAKRSLDEDESPAKKRGGDDDDEADAKGAK